MEKWRYYIGYSLVAITGVLILCTVFEGDNALVNGLVMGKVCWAQRIVPFFCLAVLLGVLFKGGSCFFLSFADLALLAFVGITYLFYDKSLNPEPEKLFFEGQLLLLWFALRIALSTYPGLKNFFILLFLFIGGVEVVTGLLQLYGMQSSNHHLFRLTGSFYNPGPYSGFLSMLLPLSLFMALKTKKIADRRGRFLYKFLHYSAWLVVALIFIVLPSGMSRAAWIAATISSGWVYWIQEIGLQKSKCWITEHKKSAIALSVAFFVLFITFSAGIYLLKKDSANGRLLLWKITSMAITEQPFTGTGVGGFPATYGKQQAAYFASGNYSQTEALVAGAPEYAFNEFLQIGVERGILVLLIFFSFLGISIYKGVKNRKYGTVGGIFALCVFSLASYPLQLPDFPIVLVFLSAISVTGREYGKSASSFFILIPTFIFSAVIYNAQQDTGKQYREWSRLQQLYNSKAYEVALPYYEALYPSLKHKPEFLFEMGQCQSKTGQYDGAVVTLKRASLLSADPMIHYMIAKNEQQRGNYEEAEQILIHAINILPERIYPYYLLVYLYNEPGFYQEDKLKASANAVLTKEPKVLSSAIQEMREETRKIISNVL
ncbi:O-antigen ligase family protein [Massilibacteroides vaginae]|uniref:O-antigen ligase family protein n=1 Tax=Massilibacteroides vaginae TaxID=1673718 RepID=UPI000A1CEAB6|nr:O-antigen ligase family protein [Massilibacteroides vaginae]